MQCIAYSLSIRFLRRHVDLLSAACYCIILLRLANMFSASTSPGHMQIHTDSATAGTVSLQPSR